MDPRKALVPVNRYDTSVLFKQFRLALLVKSLLQPINVLLFLLIASLLYALTALWRIGHEEPVEFYTDGVLENDLIQLIETLYPDTVYVYIERGKPPARSPVPSRITDLTEQEVAYYAFMLTKAFEGCRYKPYKDGKGQSIGYGFFLHASNKERIADIIGRRNFERTGLTQAESEQILRHFIAALIQHFKPRCANNRTLLAYVLKAYNRGVNGAVTNPFGCCGSRTTCGSGDLQVRKSHKVRRKIENALRSSESTTAVKTKLDKLCQKIVKCK